MLISDAKSLLIFAGMRDALSPHCVFLIVEVTLVDATYCVVVSDADPSEIPPPLRIDNASFAPIIFKQVRVYILLVNFL